jgi:hypothetical protein
VRARANAGPAAEHRSGMMNVVSRIIIAAMPSTPT